MNPAWGYNPNSNDWPIEIPFMTATPEIQLTIEFLDPDATPEKQEKQTQTLYQQLRQMDGVAVQRVNAPDAPPGSRDAVSFLWNLLQAEVSLGSIKSLLGFLADRVGNKPIKIKAKLADGREFELEASSREELLAAEETIKRLASGT
jgi:hypothetical protein